MNKRDHRLRRAYELIESKKIQVLSVDIFDTLLWRKTATPSDLFFILGKQLQQKGWLIEAIDSEGFAALRTEAESLTRLKKQIDPIFIECHEITLEEIYWNLSGVFPKITIEQFASGKPGILNESDIATPLQMEIALENDFLNYDLSIVNLIQFAHKKRIPIILVSDTYFSEAQLQFFLNRSFTILPSIKRFFASCEWGVGKRFGLFKLVQKEMQVAPDQILHIGDNNKGDIESAKAVGFQTLFYEKFSKELQIVLDRERAASSYPKNLSLDQGDFALSAMRSRVSGLLKETFQKKEQPFWLYGATVLGPILIPFTAWIYKRAADLNEKQVFCLMREGDLYANLIKEMAPYFPENPLKATKLWCSRTFMTQAGILEANLEELRALLNCHPSAKFTAKEYCNLLGLDINRIEEWKKYAHMRFEDEVFADSFLSYLVSNLAIKQKIYETAAIKRKNFLKYLSSLINLQEIEKMVLVDVGWAGTMQGLLQRIFAIEKYNISLHGLYLGTTKSAHYSLLQGGIREGFLLKAGFPQGDAAVISRGLYVLEQVGIANSHQGPLKHIDEKGIPLFHPQIAPLQQIKEANMVQEGIAAFGQLIGQYKEKEMLHWDLHSEPFIAQVREILVRAAGYPTYSEARLFSSWVHDHVSGRRKAIVLSNEQYYKSLTGHILPYRKSELQDWKMTWPAAYASEYNEALEQANYLYLRSATPIESFLSSDQLILKVFWDKGKGFNKRATQMIKMRSNANRHFYSYWRFLSSKLPIKGMKLQFCLLNSLIRINSLKLELFSLKNQFPTQFEFFESKNESLFEFTGAKRLEKNLFQCKDNPLILKKMFTDLEKDFIYAVHINLCCEQFFLKSDP